MKKDEVKKRSKTVKIVVLVLLIVLLGVVIVIGKNDILSFFEIQDTAKSGVKDSSKTETKAVNTEKNVSSASDASEKWQEGTVYYKGKNYKYNNNIKTFLFMGIDQDGKVKKAADGIGGGQSDAMFLLVEDMENKKLSIIAINRNAMTTIDVYDRSGKALGQATMQICLQHGYGDGMKLSCQRSVAAVERMFYNIPISGYLAMNMDGIRNLNDAVGGVEVTVSKDLVSGGLSLKKGEKIKLNGDEAYTYLRTRDINTFNSASDRLERQKQYLSVFVPQMKSKVNNNTSAATDIYNSISDYLVSSIDFSGLLSEAGGYKFDNDSIYTVPGKTVMGDKFEEFNIDQDGLYDLIIKVFYEEVK